MESKIERISEWTGKHPTCRTSEEDNENSMRLPYPQWNNYECQRKYGSGYGWLSYYHYPNGGYYGNHHRAFGNYSRYCSRAIQ